MTTIASQITSLTIVYSTVYSDADQRKHQSSASLAFVRGIHRGPVNSPHKWPVTRKMFPFDDVIMYAGNGTSNALTIHSTIYKISTNKLQWNLSEIWNFSFKKGHLKMSLAKVGHFYTMYRFTNECHAIVISFLCINVTTVSWSIKTPYNLPLIISAEAWTSDTKLDGVSISQCRSKPNICLHFRALGFVIQKL